MRKRLALYVLPCLCVFLCALCDSVVSSPAEKEKVSAKAVSYAELGREVRDLTGKVVLVDFWSIY
jgi:hypothetical protein